MSRRLAGRSDTIVATATIADNTDMIKSRRHPASRCMAVVAIIAAGHVCGRLARRGVAIVTRPACTNDLRMIDHRWR